VVSTLSSWNTEDELCYKASVVGQQAPGNAVGRRGWPDR